MIYFLDLWKLTVNTNSIILSKVELIDVNWIMTWVLKEKD